VIAPDQ